MNLTISKTLFIAVMFLASLSLIMVYLSSTIVAEQALGDSLFFLKRKGFFAIGAFFALFFGLKFPVEKWRSLAYPLYLACLVLLAVVIITYRLVELADGLF